MLPRLLLFILLGCSVHAHAQIVLDPAVGSIALGGRMAWLQDASAALTPDQAHAATAWQPLAGEPGFGFTRAAIWLRFEAVQPPGRHAAWRLEVNNALLEDVRVYLRTPLGGWQEQRAGRAVRHSDWPFDTRSPVFALDLEPGTHDVLLRVATRNSLSTSMRLWESERYHANARDEAVLWGGYFGLYGMVILFQTLFWRWTRETLSGWYVPYAGLNFFGLFMTLGYPQNAFDWGAGLATPLMGVVICATLGVGAQFSSVHLELQRTMPRFNRWLLGGAALITAVTCALVLAGDYGAGVGISQAASILWIAMLFGVAGLLWRRGHASARFFIAAFGIFYIGVLIRYLRNLGVLEPGIITDYSIQLGSLLHMTAMCLFIVYRYNALKIALGIEQAARQEQRDFVAMVSHEYRTPLAIISTSVQQLAANLDAPPDKTLKRCANIKRAAERMNDLLDKYLSSERLDEASQPLRLARCDPRDLLESGAQEWPPARVRLTLAGLPPEIACDRPLLEVALRNLLANADRHAPPDSVIEVSGSGGRRGLRIAVVNQGDAIPPDELSRLFQKYFRGQASRGTPGAGLGLFLVKRIVELHGGHITVTSRTGETRLEMAFPDLAVNAPADHRRHG